MTSLNSRALQIQNGFERHSSQIVGYIKDAGDVVKNVGNFTVEVTSGCHEGITVNRQPGEFTIGGSKDNDIILFGDDVAERHVKVSLPSGMTGNIRISPLEDKVVLDDGSVVEIGQYVELGSDEPFRIGDVELVIGRVANPQKFVKPGLRVLAIVCLLAMIPILYSIFSGLVFGIAGAGSKVISSINTQIVQSTGDLMGGQSNAETKEAKAYAWTVRTKLEDLKLNHRLRVSSTAEGSIRLSGTISDADVPAWTAFLRWYDTKPTFPSLIRDVKRTTIDRNLPEIKSVWLDQEPTVFLKDGTVAKIGSRLKDGWTIVSIDATDVKIERDGTIISLTY